MSQFIEGIKSLFRGPDNSLAAEQQRQREQQSVSLSKQQQDLQNNSAQQDEQLARATRLPRGRRLLLAATGEAGLSSTMGG